VASILWFDDPASDQALVGGKGGNLAKLAQAGFRVPAGFTVTTAAYSDLLDAGKLHAELDRILGQIDYTDAEGVDKRSAQIRDLIGDADLPASISAEISAAYAKLGADLFVAVRSSGTAEDLADTSFAGLHDTYLDVRGADEVVAAVKRCWASMWTARAVAYRQKNGFDHFAVKIAVVVQEMVESDVSGVLFTGNPITAATDELVINASWGLGEAVVSGMVTPDEYVVRAGDLTIKHRVLGTKLRQIRRDSQAGGTLTEDVASDKQAEYTLSDSEAAELSRLGLRVQNYYSGIPQDTEWALAKGEFYLLQSRPVTGVTFSWDNETEPYGVVEDEDTIWDRAWADEGFTGAVSPLFYSTRGYNLDRGLRWTLGAWGLDDPSQLKHFKYYRAGIYYNTASEKAISIDTIFPFARDSQMCWGGTTFIEPAAHEEVVDAPFSWGSWGLSALRRQLRKSLSWRGNITTLYERYIDNPHWNIANFPVATLPNMSDEELKRFTFEYVEEEYRYFIDIWPGFNNFRDGINLLTQLVAKWYDGSNPAALADLLTGVQKPTTTVHENVELWELSERIRNSPALSATFTSHEGPDFLADLENSDEGRAFLAEYRTFLVKRGHRGHADRDIYYPRRAEDPWVDYRAWKSMLSSGESVNPAERELEVNRNRDAMTEEVAANIRRKPLGPVKEQVFRVVLDFVQQWLMLRDNERASLDRHTYNLKLALKEAGRRLVERGIVAEPDDFYFLTKEELFEHLGGFGNRVLMQAKISGRKRNFVELYHKRGENPPYLQDGLPFNPHAADDSDPSVLRGLSQSRGSITGKVRIVPTMEQIGTVEEGEILVCNSTDPGWTPVFLVISGIVTETGGVLSHAACLSREYGLPAVQVGNAMKRIRDGATITVDGDSGEVRIVEDLDTAGETVLAAVGTP
jgi:phosphohistidine swiveling domain-containing protein